MDYFKRCNFLFAAPVFDADDLEGIRFNQIITEIERSGFGGGPRPQAGGWDARSSQR
jgi:hypothetical protein